VTSPTEVFALGQCLEAFRDSGYRGLQGALAELIDNSLEAGATTVDIRIDSEANCVERVCILDDGRGILPSKISTALQLGGSTRFDNRDGFGRYGIGLPVSSISQARRVDVYSWLRKGQIWWSYLALDEVWAGLFREIPRPTRQRTPLLMPQWATDHGTLVVWSSCDRISPLRGVDFLKLSISIGRIFRGSLWQGRRIILNSIPVMPVDPLFLKSGTYPGVAKAFGPPLQFEVELPGRGRRRRSQIDVRFSELPIEDWYLLSKTEKRYLGITNNPVVSMLRAGREIDAGWLFMGTKRKESYDDWWRCEVSFHPELDEFFGVTHTKQGVNATTLLEGILTPHLERTAHELNRRVRKRFELIRSKQRKLGRTAKIATQRDHLLEPPRVRTAKLDALRYEVIHKPFTDANFFFTQFRGNLLRIIFNTRHPFHDAVFSGDGAPVSKETMELIFLAAARAECRLPSAEDRAAVLRHREHWSNTLSAFFG
jgi:hypothetical protein